MILTAMSDSAQVACQVHPDAQAGWRCVACERALCVDCGVRHAADDGAPVFCRNCGASAGSLFVVRDQRRYASVALDAVSYTFSARGLIVVGLAGAALGVLASLTGASASLQLVRLLVAL